LPPSERSEIKPGVIIQQYSPTCRSRGHLSHLIRSTLLHSSRHSSLSPLCPHPSIPSHPILPTQGGVATLVKMLQDSDRAWAAAQKRRRARKAGSAAGL
jgi:hypothetical protein